MSDPSTRLCPLLSLIPAEEIAQACDMSMRSFRRAIAAGQLPPPIRIRRRLFYRASDLERWLEGEAGRATSAESPTKGQEPESTEPRG